MRSFFILLFLLVFTCTTRAQKSELDSLKNELLLHPAEDSVRMKILYYCSFYYYSENPETGLKYADELIALAKKKDDVFYLGKGFFCKGINYGSAGNYTDALAAYKNAKLFFEKANVEKYTANVNNSMAVVYQSLSDYPRALEIYYNNLKFFERLKDSFMVALTCSNIGLVYKYLGQYPQSTRYHQRSIDIQQKLGNLKELSDAYNNMGTTYQEAGNIEKSLDYYKQALSISEPINYSRCIASSITNIGIANSLLGNHVLAYQYLQKALPLYLQNGNMLARAEIQKILGEIYLSAEPLFFTELNKPISKRYALANEYFDSSLYLYKQLNDIAGQAELWKQFSGLYETKGNFSKALSAYKNFATLKESLLNDEGKKRVTQLEMNYSFKIKEDSILAENDKKSMMAASEIKRETTIKKSIVWGSAIVFVAALMSFIFYKKRRDSKQKQQEAEFKSKVSDTEMKALRSQMNPHFIFNSLNSIGDYIGKNDPLSADRYLTKFAKLMRLILENAEQKEVPLADDLKALELYMQLEALRMNHTFTYEINTDESIDLESTMVPPLILQPFVENSIWHGFANKKEDGKIIINVKRDGTDMISCTVEDNGVGRKSSAFAKDVSKIKGEKSLGVKITQSRIDILNKIKNSKAAVEFFDLSQGLRVEVKLPLALNF
ncbi:MAG: tetratricopeptide repeat protein [Ferruginibacter sp.]